MERTPTLEEAEAVEILKGIARDSRSDNARIAALRQLRDFDLSAQSDDEMDALDREDELARRRKRAG